MKYKKTAIIFGISGQDGAYLSNFLLQKGYKVIGTTRNRSIKNLYRLKKLNIIKKVNILKGVATNLKFCEKILSKNISEIYYLSGDSSVINSFETPDISLKSNTEAILNILETLKRKKYKSKLFNAGSGQFFGDNKNNFYDINSKIDPQSPYGVSKAAAYWLVKIYREKYNIYCCTGILFNHESPLRSKEFVTKKIIDTAIKIKKNRSVILRLGNVNIYRDWGWAPDYIKAIWLMMQRNTARDFIIGSGKTHSLKEFVDKVFRYLKISKKNLKTDVSKYKRKIDIRGYKANIIETQKLLKWKPSVKFNTIIYKMINNELF